MLHSSCSVPYKGDWSTGAAKFCSTLLQSYSSPKPDWSSQSKRWWISINWPIEATTIVENEAGEAERSPDYSITRIDGGLVVQFLAARSAQAAIWSKMRARDGTVKSSRFERRLPGGQHKPAFRVAFGTYGAAARAPRFQNDNLAVVSRSIAFAQTCR